jgi:hypothetical protein
MTKRKFVHVFIFTAGAILLITAIAKVVSAMGTARILGTPDPIFSIPFRDVFWIVGAIELAVAGVCFFGKRIAIQSSLVAWLATSFVLYRFGLKWVGYQKGCSCLGNLTDALHISPASADIVLKIIVAYLLIGSYAVLLSLYYQRRVARQSSNPIEAPAPSA